MKTPPRPSWIPCLALILGLGLAAGAARAAEAPALLFFGDSLTAGYGLEDPATEAFPALIQRRIQAAGLAWRVVNAGLSGETSAGGLRRVDWVLRQRVDCFVLELGGNDGLRGIPPATTEANLQAIIDRVRARDPAAKIVLVGIEAPPNMGPDFTRAFAAIFPALAARNHLPLIPFLLEGVAGQPGLNQADGIHPTARGHAIVAETVWKVLRPLL
ncbi:MAG TPA: arylesterase [Opitutaceae bacterium]|nr:arylesterase [Opitutaceae bacterium]